MKKHQNGFSIVEIILVIIVLGLMATIGWLLFTQQTKTTTLPPTNTYSYSFKELGISMDILNGWEVKANPTTQEGAHFYSWTVEKPGADGKIELSSSGFRGSFIGCSNTDPLTAATVTEVSKTQNDKLLLMTWSYNGNNHVDIVRPDETVFKKVNDRIVPSITNDTVTPGNYFFCAQEPMPGFFLHLNDELAAGFSRHERINAVASSSSDTNFAPLAANAQSFSDIKTMLTSIK